MTLKDWHSRRRLRFIAFAILILSSASIASHVALASGQRADAAESSAMTWHLLDSDYDESPFRDVKFLNATHGWIVGQANESFASDLIVLHTNDSGDSWELQFTAVSGIGASLDVVDEKTVWVTGNHRRCGWRNEYSQVCQYNAWMDCQQ